MASRVRRPDTDILPISGGDTLTVKRFLTAAEFRELIKASTKPVRVGGGGPATDIALEVDPTESGLAIILAYLLDWTFTDFDGRPLVIRDRPREVVRAALDIIDGDSYLEVQRAIQDHDTAMRAYIAEEKKTNTSARPLDRILRSVE